MSGDTTRLHPAVLGQRFPALLARVHGEGLDVLGEFLSAGEAQPGQVLCRFEEPADSLLLIYRGRLELSIRINGRPAVLGSLGPGRMLGVTAVIEPGPASATATVAEPATILRLSHGQLQHLRLSHPRLGGNLLRGLSLVLAERLRVFEDCLAERTRPGELDEVAGMARRLLGMGDA